MCQEGQAQEAASFVVRELLATADSHQWASLNDVLPLLAEAAPDEFLNAVGGASERSDEPFTGIFAEEGGPFFGSSYLTCLLYTSPSPRDRG